MRSHTFCPRLKTIKQVHYPHMSVIIDPIAIDEVLSRGVADCIEREHLRAQLLSGKQLRIKFGIDPTSPHMHLGHTVPLRKLRQFQDLGHQAVLIIGDATAMIGDPTGRSEARKQLSRKDIDKNKKTYVKQAGKILDLKTLEIRHNGEWFDKMHAAEFLGLTSLVTVQQVLQREDFRKRVDDPDHPLSTIELTYPVMQGYDSVVIKADLEIGGHDQLLNVLMGRRIQRKFDMPEQDVLTVPLVEGTDGNRKMSKSFENAIFLEAEPEDMFGQVMSVPDDHILPYFTLLTSLPTSDIDGMELQMKAGVNPRDLKLRLATVLVTDFHGAKKAKLAVEHFASVFQQHEKPTDMVDFQVAAPMNILDVLVATKLATSRGDGKQLIAGGGVRIDDVTVTDVGLTINPIQLPAVLQKGKRYFVRLVV